MQDIGHSTLEATSIMLFCPQIEFDGYLALQLSNYHISPVMSWAKFHSDHYVRIEVRAKLNFHQIWIVTKTPFVKSTPAMCYNTHMQSSLVAIQCSWLYMPSIHSHLNETGIISPKPLLVSQQTLLPTNGSMKKINNLHINQINTRLISIMN